MNPKYEDRRAEKVVTVNAADWRRLRDREKELLGVIDREVAQRREESARRVVAERECTAWRSQCQQALDANQALYARLYPISPLPG